MSASLDTEAAHSRAQLAIAIRHEISMRKYGEEVRRIVLCILRAGLDLGRSEAVFPTQRKLAIVARMCETKLSEGLSWLAERKLNQIGKPSDGVSAPEAEAYILSPFIEEWQSVKLLTRFLPLSEREKAVWAEILSPTAPPQLDCFPREPGLAEALTEVFADGQKFEVGRAGVLSLPPDPMRAATEGDASLDTASSERPLKAGTDRITTEHVAAPSGETPTEYGGGSVSSPSRKQPNETIEQHCERVRLAFLNELPQRGSTSPRGKADGSPSPTGKLVLPQEGSTQNVPAGTHETVLPQEGSTRARPRIASLALIEGTSAKLAKTEEAISAMRTLSPSEYARFGEDGWRQAAEQNPKRLLSLLDYGRAEQEKRLREFEAGQREQGDVINNLLAWLRPRAEQIGLLKRKAKRRER